MMKKLICILLCLTVLISTGAFCIAAADDSLSFIVASDLHYAKTPSAVSVNFPDDKYYCADGQDTLVAESKAIIKQFLREAAASDAQFVLLCGDLAEDGSVAQHKDVANLLSDFETRTGKDVYVIDGNHDFNSGITAQKFKELYAAFGYDKALTVDEESCSYTLDLNDDYRLMALDTCTHAAFNANDSLTEERLAWADAQAQQAKKDGKKLVVIQHHNFLEHVPMQSKLMPSSVVRLAVDMKTRFLNWNVRYVFTGHMHGHDMMAYTDGVGRRVYDILTTSLSGYPCAYRTCALTSEGMDIKTVRIQGVDAADLPRSGYSPELLEELTNDLDTYAKGCFKISFTVIKDSYFSEASVRRMLSRFVGESVEGLIDLFYPTFYKMMTLPIYTKDAEDGESLEAYGEKLGLKFPQTDKTYIFDSIFYFISTVYDGDENVPYDDPEITLAMQCTYTAVYTGLSTIRSDLRQQLLDDVRANFSDTALPLALTTALKTAVGTVKDEKLLETVLLLAAPFIEEFSIDDETPDNDAFLADADGAKTTFFTQIADFFRTLFAYIGRFFKGIIYIYFPIRRTNAF